MVVGMVATVMETRLERANLSMKANMRVRRLRFLSQGVRSLGQESAVGLRKETRWALMA